MAIDNELILEATQYSLGQLNNATATASPDALLIANFLHPVLLEKLLQFLSSSDIVWGKEIRQEKSPREKISWIPESPIEETHMVLENLTDSINSTFNRTDYFRGMSIWRDRYPYSIPKHHDNSNIDVSLQLYLTECAIDLATKFEYNNKILSANYIKNSGYIMNNSAGGLAHYLTTPIPLDHTRISLYAIWSRA